MPDNAAMVSRRMAIRPRQRSQEVDFATMRTATLALLASLLPCLPLAGQQKTPDAPAVPGAERNKVQDPARPHKEPPRRPEPSTPAYDPANDKNLTPEQRAELGKKRGTRGFVRFEHSCDPARVPPGGSGRLAVVMVLQGDSVLPDPPPVYFAVPPDQGPLQIGTPTFRPGKPARLAEAFKGKPAYDHYAIFDVPFTVAATARPGQQPLLLDLSYDLYAGKTGAHIDRFTDRITAQIAIGTSSGGPPEATAVAPQAASPPTDDRSTAAATTGRRGGTGQVELTGDVLPTGDGAPGNEVASEWESLPGEASSPASLPLLLAGGVLLAGIGLVVLRRRG